MASDRQLEVALVVKAQLDAARKQVAALEAELSKVGKEGKSADKNLRGTGQAVDQLGDTSRQTAGEVDRASASIGKMDKAAKSSHAALDRASKDMHRVGLSAGEQRNAMRMLPAQMTDIVTGLISGQPAYMVAIQQGGQLRDSFGGFGGALKGIGQIITPTRLLIGGLTGTVALLVAALIKGILNAQHLESALIATGNYAGTTATQLQNLATTVADDNGGYADARKAVLLLAQSGKITEDALNDAARGAVAFAQLTGASIEDAVDAVVSLQDKPVDAVRKLNQQYHFLEASTYDQIQALQEQGETAQAAALAQKAFADAMEERRNRDVQNLGAIQRAWKSVRDEMSKTWNLLLSFGSQSDQHQLDMLYARRGAQQDRVNNPLGKILGYHDDAVAEVAAIDKQIAALKKKIAAEKDANEAESTHRQEQEAGVAALARINARTQQNATAAQRYAEQIKKINADFDTAIKAMPKKADELNAQRSKQLRTLADSYAESLTSANSGGGGGNNNVSAGNAAARAKAAASAQQQLIDTLQQLQAVQDPVASAWVKYWNVVDKATAAANKAKQATGANTAAIDGQLAAIKTLAAGTRDAAIDKLADKDRKAWEQFRASLQTPLEAHVNDAVAAIDMLNKHMAKGKMTADQYQGLVDRIFAKAAGQGSLRRVHTAGPAGGILDTQTQESADYQRQMDLIAGIRDKVLADEQANYAQRLAAQRAYEQASDRLTQLHAQNQQALERQKAQFALQAAQAGFGALAQAAAQAYGEHSKQARIAFALQKAAAVASAALAIQQSIANSAKIGYPWNIVAIAGAIAQGVAVLASVRSVQPGFAEGGYTGRGGKYQVAGVVHAGEGVLSQRDMAALGGPRAFDDFRRGLHGYADGGYVNPLASAPSPAELGFSAPRLPKLAMPDASAAAGASGAHHVKVVVVSNMEQAAIEAMNTPAGHKVIVQTAGDNPNAIKGKWGS